jgi:hypothetical protein
MNAKLIDVEWLEGKLDRNAELRNENHRYRVFILALIDPEMYGHAVSAEVRGAAKRLVQGFDDE